MLAEKNTGNNGAAFCTALAAWAAGSRPKPEAARREARLAVLDTIGCILAGGDQRQTRAARGAAGARPAVSGKALILGTAAHALDFDDYETPGSTHPSAPMLGALLALAEERPVTWGELTDAYVVGYEAIVRLGETLGYAHYAAGWHATGTLGGLGTAAAVATLLGLPEERLSAALSLAASMSAGLKVQFGSDAKALHAGLAARAGLEAALLAEAGATANPEVFDGAHGFFALYGGRAAGTRRTQVSFASPLGIERSPILRKPWPSCAYTHRVIEAALALAAGSPVAAEELARATIRMPEPYFRVSGFLRPSNPNEARFSVVYCVAAALSDGAITLASFDPEAISRPEILKLMEKITVETYELDPDAQDMSPDHPDSVEVTLRDGRRLARSVGQVAGGPEAPLTLERLRRKFAECGGDAELAETILGAVDQDVVRLAVTEMIGGGPMTG